MEDVDEDKAEALMRRMEKGSFDLEDFLDQMQSMKKMGGLKSMLKMLPGNLGNIEFDENAMKKPEAIILSMTKRERRNPDLLNASRRKRIAAGSGTTVQEINQLINNFENARSMMKQVSGKGKGKLKRMMRNMPQMPK